MILFNFSKCLFLHIQDLFLLHLQNQAKKMSILEYNGAGVVAMTGKNCVAIASDTRYGIRQQTVGTDMKKVFKIHDKLFIGMTGLATDIQTVEEKLKFKINMYNLKEERDIKPSSFANLVSNMLYEKR